MENPHLVLSVHLKKGAGSLAALWSPPDASGEAPPPGASGASPAVASGFQGEFARAISDVPKVQKGTKAITQERRPIPKGPIRLEALKQPFPQSPPPSFKKNSDCFRIERNRACQSYIDASSPES